MNSIRLFLLCTCLLAGTARAATFDVTAYGAVGDDSTDNTAAFTACLNAIVAAGGGKMVLPDGVYRGNPLFPRLRSGHRLFQRPSPKKQFPSISNFLASTFSWKNPYPSDDQLREWSRHGSILVLHSWIWQGNTGSRHGVMMDDSWAVSKYVPKSENELVRVVKTAHDLGMKVIVYMSPYYFKGGGIDDFVAAVDQAMKTHSLDGVYFDGIVETHNDIMGAYDVTRKTREAIGDERILYIHSTISPLKEIYCPFIDCYADFLLRGEHRKTSEDGFRWYVSSYNLGNAIGTLCYDTQRPTRELIDLMFRVNARLPYWVDDGTWNKQNYHLSEQEMEIMKTGYFPRLKQEAAKR